MVSESCALEWIAAIATCKDDTGVSIPDNIAGMKYEDRVRLCACRTVVAILNMNMSSNCADMLTHKAVRYPGGIQDVKLCSSTQAMTPSIVTAIMQRSLETESSAPESAATQPPESSVTPSATTQAPQTTEASTSEPTGVPTTPDVTSSPPATTSPPTTRPIETGPPEVTPALPPTPTTFSPPASTTPAPSTTNASPLDPPPPPFSPSPVNTPPPPNVTPPPPSEDVPSPSRSVMTSAPAPNPPASLMTAAPDPTPTPVNKASPSPSASSPQATNLLPTPISMPYQSTIPITFTPQSPQATVSNPVTEAPANPTSELSTMTPQASSTLTPLATSTSPPSVLAQPSLRSTADPPSSNGEQDTQQSDLGFSPTVIAISGGVVVLVIAVALVLVRMAQSKHRRRTVEEEDLVAKYRADLNSPRTAAGSTLSVPWAGSVLATSRIPMEKIYHGPVISQGGYGEVSRGYYNGQEVAVKRLLVSRRKDLFCIHDFLEEIKLTATLDHECIAKFIGVAWDAPSDLCMVSEFLPGGDLRSLLSRRARDREARGFDDDKLRIALQVAHALTYLHTLQPVVVHRDLKSRNVLLTAHMDAKLIDFGVSTERCDVTMTAGVGTSLWMAPEMMLGQRYDEKADIFSFGVVLSELDTHELPYAQVRESPSGRLVNDMVVMQLVSQGKLIPQFSETADVRIVDLAKDCLQLDPTKRPSASEVLYLIHRTRRAGVLEE